MSVGSDFEETPCSDPKDSVNGDIGGCVAGGCVHTKVPRANMSDEKKEAKTPTVVAEVTDEPRPVYLSEFFAKLLMNEKFADCYFKVGWLVCSSVRCASSRVC
jgi:hypothetical protein